MTAVLALGLLIALAWTALAARVVLLLRDFRPLGPSDEPAPDDAPAVAAIVPAHNEERDIEEAVRTIRAQAYPRLSLTVVDDRSTDATGAILDRLAVEPSAVPLRVIHGVARPAGWVGKTWALKQGVDGVQADWLWFVDGDMGLHPRALATALREANATGADLVTFAPRAVCETFWQGTVALAITQLLMHLYPVGRVNDPGRPEAMAIGGFILVRRSTYEAAGGHEAVRAEIVEDIELGRRVKAGGGRLALRVAPDLAWTHMYGDFRAIWRGLRKNAYAGMDYLFHKYAVGAVVALALAWVPVLTLAAGLILTLRGGGPLGFALIVAGVWGWLAQAAAAVPFLVFLRLPPPMALSLPAGISAYVAIATASVVDHARGRVVWKDVTFSASEVRSGDRPAMGPAGAAPAPAAGPSPAAGPASSPPPPRPGAAHR